MATILDDDHHMRVNLRQDAGSASRQEHHLVERLAKETGTPEHEARSTYEREQVDRDARVKTFVSVIAARHARDTLRRKPR